MLDMKKNTGAKVSALIGSTLALGTIFGLVSRSAQQTVADTPAPDAAAQSQTLDSSPAAAAPAQPATQAQVLPTTAAAPAARPRPTATAAPPPQSVRTKHTRTRSS